MNRRLTLACAIGMASLAGMVARGGGGPQHVLLVVNDNSPASLELGQYYRMQRALPGINVMHIRTPVGYSMTTAAFTNDIWKPVTDYLAAAGLTNQVDYVVFSCDIPYRVYDGTGPFVEYRSSGLTAAMFYGFKASPNAFVYGCQLAAGSASRYYGAERAFRRSEEPSHNDYFLSSILTATNLATAKQMIDRSVQADAGLATGTIFLLHSSDPYRNIQWPQFQHVDFTLRCLPRPHACELLDADAIHGRSNVIGYAVGQKNVADISNNAYAPGAIAEHLTSYGGCLFDSDPHEVQMSILDWVRAGAAGSYGTVVEPCGYTNKFPNELLHVWYARGFNLGESLWMSVQHPYQGVVVGDPLSAPYAQPPAVACGGLVSGQVVVGTLALTITGTPAVADGRVSRLDLYLDDRYLTTLTNLAPRRFNMVTATLNGSDRVYAVKTGDDLMDVAAGLAAAINAAPALGVTARALGDRIEIRQDALGTNGAWMTCAAASATGTAAELNVAAWSPWTNFLETTFPAHEEATLYGTPMSGDVVRAVVTTLAGATVTNEVRAGVGDTVHTLMGRLESAVNAHPALQSSTGCRVMWRYGTDHAGAFWVARTNAWPGANLYLTYSVITQAGSSLVGPNFSDRFNDNADVLGARAVILLMDGAAQVTGAYDLDTTTLADGPHTLRIVATDGTAVRTEGQLVVPWVADNTAMACGFVCPPAGAGYLLSQSVAVTVTAAAPVAVVTAVVLRAEGKEVARDTTAPYEFVVPATNYGVGSVALQAGAYGSDGTVAFSELREVRVLPDADADGLDDDWEIREFGAITNWTGADDPDGDGANNGNEYLADTEPTNRFSKLMLLGVTGLTNEFVQMQFWASTGRQYRMHCRETDLPDAADWSAATQAFAGSNAIYTWRDDGRDLPVSTNTRRYYRMGASRP